MSLLLTSDFTGNYRVPETKGDWTSDFAAVIIDVEEETFRKLLGDSLYTSYLTDSTLQKWVDLVDGNTYEYDSTTYINSGLKKALLGITYFHWAKDAWLKLHDTGFKVDKSENSKKSMQGFTNGKLYDRYRRGAGFYREVGDFVCRHQEITEVANTITDNANGTYTVDVDDLFYISAGIVIELDGQEFTVNSVDTLANTFIFSATAGQAFSTTFSYNAFPNWEYQTIKNSYGF